MSVDWSKIKNFRRDEWTDDPDQVNQDLVIMLDKIRDLAGVPIVIHVAWASSGHAANGWHYRGQAADFHFGGKLTVWEQYSILSVQMFGAIGWYPEWNNPGWHVDLRPAGKERLCWICEGNVYRYENVLMGGHPSWITPDELFREDPEEKPETKECAMSGIKGTLGKVGINVLEALIPFILTNVTPALLDQLRDLARTFKAKAAETPNPWDDLLANVLCALIGADGE